MLLSRLTSQIDCKQINFKDTDITGIEFDSRKVKEGNIYICINGFHVDGHIYALPAIENGASAIIAERVLEGVDVPQLIVKNSREAFAICASTWFDNPSKDLKVIGITGTNGKTTTSHMLKIILDANGIKNATVGTIGTYIDNVAYSQKLTTPDPVELQQIFALARDKNCEVVIMEVSAHALELNKVSGIKFFASAFTNLSQDHLDDFEDMTTYGNAKKKLFSEMSERAVINIDDKSAENMISDYSGQLITYSTKDSKSNFYGDDIKLSEDGFTYTMTAVDKKAKMEIQIPGLFNVYNSLAASAIAFQLGISIENIEKAVRNITNVDGRMEKVNIDADFHVFVDYAHSSDSLENLLVNVNKFCEGRLICVFGCGGDRDNLKRPIMGRIAGKNADFSIVTSDNPRTEEPDSIIDMIEVGIREVTDNYIRITDRKLAIEKALDMASAKDIVVVAGKGHETYQDVMGTKHHFDDREIVREYMKKRGN